MRLVDDDDAEVVKHVSPPVVVRQHPDVEHVRVGEDRVRGSPHVRALLDRRVTVVDRRSQPGKAEPGEPPRLILRQGLGRVEEEGARGAVARDRIESGQ